MAKLNFDPKKLTEDAVKQSMVKLKEDFEREVDRIASEYDEKVKIAYIDLPNGEFRIAFDAQSPELREKIQRFIEESGKN